jgi:hypothetical protein
VAFVNTRRRRLALAAVIVLAGSVGVYVYQTSTGPEQVLAQACAAGLVTRAWR